MGDGEDSGPEATSVDANGAVLGGGDVLATPEAKTRQANRLMKYGFSGYAGAARLYRQAALAGYAPATPRDREQIGPSLRGLQHFGYRGRACKKSSSDGSPRRASDHSAPRLSARA